MDIVLEQLMGYVDEIASLVSQAAPQVWQMLLLQVRVEMVGHILWTIVGLIVLGVGLYTIKPIKDHVESGKYSSYDSPRAWYIVTAFLTTLGAMVFFTSLYEAIARVINPAWYAIQLLITQVQ